MTTTADAIATAIVIDNIEKKKAAQRAASIRKGVEFGQLTSNFNDARIRDGSTERGWREEDVGLRDKDICSSESREDS